MTIKWRKWVLTSLFVLVTAGGGSWSRAAESLINEGTVDFQTTDKESPLIDPENPSEEIGIDEPILSTKGPLRFDYIPSFSFGSQKISDKDQEYFTDPIPLVGSGEVRANYLQVTDNRETGSGWRVTVKQEIPFQSKKDPTLILKGAYLSFDNQWVSSANKGVAPPTISKETIEINDVGASIPLAEASVGAGVGTWAISFGSAHDNPSMKKTLVAQLASERALEPQKENPSQLKNTSVRLFVPGNTEKYQEHYYSVLTWTISEL